MGYELIIENGRVVTPDGEKNWDIGIKNGKIAALSAPGMLSDSERKIDASGKYIFPGGIDVHVHMDDLGAEDLEDWRHGSFAAAAGGITTVADMPIDCVPSTVSSEAVRRKLDRIRGNAYTDYLLWGGLTTDNLRDVEGMLKEGIAGLKSFLVDSGAEDFVRTSDAVLLEAMYKASEKGFPIIIHAENEEMNRYYTEKYGKNNNWADLSRMHPEAGELEAVSKCLLFSELTGARVHIAHLSSSKSVRLVAKARKKGVRVSCETCPHYLVFSEKDYEEKKALLKCAPPVRDEENRKKLWEELKHGDIDMISSDHSPNYVSGNDSVCQAWAGISGIQNTLSVLYSEGFCRGRLSLGRIAGVFALNGAKLLGIDKQKGSIEIGKDADLVLLNPQKETIFDRSLMRTRIKSSVYQDFHFRGRIEQTFLRGVRVESKEPGGRYICR